MLHKYIYLQIYWIQCLSSEGVIVIIFGNNWTAGAKYLHFGIFWRYSVEQTYQMEFQQRFTKYEIKSYKHSNSVSKKTNNYSWKAVW